jgi:hypothetical protein
MHKTVKVGALYQHYSGKCYKVVAIGYGSEDLKQYIVYQGLYNDPKFGDQPIWIRPLEMFLETVEIKGVTQLRFKQLAG